MASGDAETIIVALDELTEDVRRFFGLGQKVSLPEANRKLHELSETLEDLSHTKRNLVIQEARVTETIIEENSSRKREVLLQARLMVQEKLSVVDAGIVVTEGCQALLLRAILRAKDATSWFADFPSHNVGRGRYIIGDTDIFNELARVASGKKVRQDSLATNGLVDVTLDVLLPDGRPGPIPPTCSSELQKLLGEEPCDAIEGWGWGGGKKSFTINFPNHEVKVTSLELQSARLQSCKAPGGCKAPPRKPWVFRSGVQEITVPPSKEVEVAGPNKSPGSRIGKLMIGAADFTQKLTFELPRNFRIQHIVLYGLLRKAPYASALGTMREYLLDGDQVIHLVPRPS